MTQSNLLLISSSYAGNSDYLAHCWDAIKNFYGATGNSHILFIPYANAYDWRWFTNECVPYFEEHGIQARSILDYDEPKTALDDKGLSGIFMAGGNTFKLLKCLYDYDLITPIQQRVVTGLPYVGVSAGAVVACPGIYTTNDMPMIEPESFQALGIVPFQINPHFVPGELIANHHGETREQRIQQFHTEHKTPVIGLQENSWLEIHGNSILLGGNESGTLFGVNEEPVLLNPGELPEPIASKLLGSSNIKTTRT